MCVCVCVLCECVCEGGVRVKSGLKITQPERTLQYISF